MLSSWSSDNSLVIAPAKAPSGPLASAVATPNFPPVVVKQDYGYDNKSIRKLLNESHGIFLRFLNSVKHVEGKTVNSHTLRNISMDFRVCIRACCQDLERTLTDIGEHGQGDRDYEAHVYSRVQHQLEIHRQIEMIWGLFDALFFRPQGSWLIADLLEWSRWCFTEPDKAVREMLNWQKDGNGTRKLEDHEQYWNTVFTFVLSGRIEECSALFDAYSQRFNSGAFQSISEVVNSCPLSELATGGGHQEFLIWQDDVKKRLERGDFVMVPQLEMVAKLCLGDDGTYRRLASSSPTWYPLVVGRALFTQPLAKIYDLNYLAEECIEAASKTPESWTPVDKTMTSLFQLDILTALKELCASFQNWWCPAHLGLLLYHGGCMELFTVRHSVDLREYLLFEYGESLMNDGRGLWQLAVDYLVACPTYGIGALRIMLERIAINMEDTHKILKVLDVCRKYNLFETAKTICKEKSIAALKSGSIPDALTWCFQARDSQFATYIAEQLLRLHCTSPFVQQLEILDNLGEIALLSPVLTFLCKYREMCVLHENGRYTECASLLSDLIASQIAPREFWMVLLEDVMDLLKMSEQEPLFTAEDTFKIMDVLQSVVLDVEILKNRNYFVNQGTEEAFRHDVKQLKLALVKNLANAMTQKSA